MKRTVYIPDKLADRVDAYLDRHPDLTLSALVQEALERRLTPPDLRGLLKLAGIVPRVSRHAHDRAEDQDIGRER